MFKNVLLFFLLFWSFSSTLLYALQEFMWEPLFLMDQQFRWDILKKVPFFKLNVNQTWWVGHFLGWSTPTWRSHTGCQWNKFSWGWLPKVNLRMCTKYNHFHTWSQQYFSVFHFSLRIIQGVLNDIYEKCQACGWSYSPCMLSQNWKKLNSFIPVNSSLKQKYIIYHTTRRAQMSATVTDLF